MKLLRFITKPGKWNTEKTNLFFRTKEIMKISTHSNYDLLESVSVDISFCCCYEWTISAASASCTTFMPIRPITSYLFKFLVSEILPSSQILQVFHFLLYYSRLHTKMLLILLFLKNV